MSAWPKKKHVCTTFYIFLFSKTRSKWNKKTTRNWWFFFQLLMNEFTSCNNQFIFHETNRRLDEVFKSFFIVIRTRDSHICKKKINYKSRMQPYGNIHINTSIGLATSIILLLKHSNNTCLIHTKRCNRSTWRFIGVQLTFWSSNLCLNQA